MPGGKSQDIYTHVLFNIDLLLYFYLHIHLCMHILFHFNMSICYFAHLLIVVNVDVNKVKRAALEQHEFPFWSRVVNASLVLAHSFYRKTY